MKSKMTLNGPDGEVIWKKYITYQSSGYGRSDKVASLANANNNLTDQEKAILNKELVYAARVTANAFVDDIIK